MNLNYLKNLNDLKFPRTYWIVSSVLVLSGIACMIAGAVRVKADRNANLVCTKEEFPDISKLDVAVSAGNVILEQDPEIQTCTVEITSVSDNIHMNSQDGTLQIRDTGKQMIQIFSFGVMHLETTEIKITVPAETYQQIKITSDVGECRVSGVDATEFRLNSSVGNFQISDCSVDTLNLETGTGDTRIENVTVAKYCDLDSDIGMLTAKNLTCAGKTELDLGTGDCRIENAVFSGTVQAESDIGAIHMQQITLDGSLTIDADTGDVSVSVNGRKDDFVLQCSSDVGDVRVDQIKTGRIQQINNNTNYNNKNIIISTDIGSINLDFLET